MSIKAIFAQGTLPYWIDVAAELCKKYGWEICYFVGSEKQKQKAKELFPNVLFHTKTDAIRNQIPEGCKSLTPSPLDKELLSSLAFHESIFMKMMDRYNYDGALTYHKRIFIYHSQVMHWKAVIENFNPDVVVYRIAPHMGYDYVLYALCRIMDIPTIMFERTSLPGFVYPVKSFEDGSAAIRQAYTEALTKNHKRDISLTPETSTHFENLSRSYAQAMPFHLRYKLNHFKKSGEVGGTISVLSHVVKEFGKEFMVKRRGPEYLHKAYHKNMGRFRRKRLLAHYTRLAGTPDLRVPYVFVALQCEPERQTSPVGGIFGNQYLMIDLLSKLVPENWKLYVKEHVSQFKEYQAGERAKTLEYYDRIASIPKVELVPLSYTSFELIDHAKASATVSGSVGWESVVRGKPALLFGYSWYRDCRGVFTTHTVEACKKAIKEIQNGYQINQDDVKCFAQVVERCSIKGYIDKLYDKMDFVSPEENICNLARAIHEVIT